MEKKIRGNRVKSLLRKVFSAFFTHFAAMSNYAISSVRESDIERSLNHILKELELERYVGAFVQALLL